MIDHKTILLFLLLLTNNVQADTNEIDFTKLDIVEYVIQSKCFDSYEKVIPRLYERPYEYGVAGEWHYDISYITDGTFIQPGNRTQLNLSNLTGYLGGEKPGDRIQWINPGLVLQVGGDTCQGHGIFMDTTYLDYSAIPGIALGGGGLAYGYGWEWEDAPSPWEVEGNNLMLQAGGFKLPISYTQYPADDHAIGVGITTYYRHETGRLIAMVTSLYDSRYDYLSGPVNCREVISTDNVVLFSSTYLGTNDCPRENLKFLTPSPYSDLSKEGGTWVEPKFMRFHITEKDFEDQLQEFQSHIISRGDFNNLLTEEELQAEGWRLVIFAMISEFAPNIPEKGEDIFQLGYSFTDMSAYIVRN